MGITNVKTAKMTFSLTQGHLQSNSSCHLIGYT